jgi:hypothetical protein
MVARVRTTPRYLAATIALAAIVAGCGSGPSSATPSSSLRAVTSFEQLVADQQAFDGRQITVTGSLVEIGGTPVLCATLAEVFPDGCSEARLVLLGAVPAELMGQTVTVTGIFQAERGPAAMQFVVHEIRPTGS